MASILPEVSMLIRDYGLGVIPVSALNLHLKIGAAAKGTQNQILTFTSPEQIKEVLGSGPLAESLAWTLALSGGPVYGIRAETATAAAASSVTATRAAGSPTSDGTVSVATATDIKDAYDVHVKITRTGSKAGANAAFIYSVDGGDNWSQEIVLANYTIPDTGINVVFTDGVANPTFRVGDLFKFTTTPPLMTVTNVNTAIDAALADSREWGFVHLVGEASPTVFAALATKMTTAEAQFRFAFALMEARDISATTDSGSEDTWMTNLITEYASSSSVRVAVAAGHAEIASPLTGQIQRRSIGSLLAAWLTRLQLHENPGKVRAGSVPGIVKLYHNEYSKPGLDAKGFTTIRTFTGMRGFYFTDFHMMAPANSDYFDGEHRRVMDLSCSIARSAFLPYVLDNVRVDTLGRIQEEDAQQIEGWGNGQLESGVVFEGHASAVTTTINRQANILSTRKLPVKIRVTPLGKIREIEVDIGFINPALQPAVAADAAGGA